MDGDQILIAECANSIPVAVNERLTMPRQNSNSSTIKWHTPGSKGKSRRGTKIGTYSRMNKRAKAERYDRPGLKGQIQ